MQNTKILLNYKGPIEFETIERLLQKVKMDLEKLNLKKVLKKRVYNILVECIENIHKHHAPKSDTQIHPYIMLEQGDESFLITAGNLIANTEVPDLKEKLNIVSGLNKDELLRMYEKQINKKDILLEDGAGLGIVTIAIKSNSSISYTFSEVNNVVSVYELKVSVPLYVDKDSTE